MSTLRAIQEPFARQVLACAERSRPAVRRSQDLARGHATVVVRCHEDRPDECSVQLGPGVTLVQVLNTLRTVIDPGGPAPSGRLCYVHGYVDRTELQGAQSGAMTDTVLVSRADVERMLETIQAGGRLVERALDIMDEIREARGRGLPRAWQRWSDDAVSWLEGDS